MLTGELPMHQKSPRRPPKVHIDVRLDEIVLRALQKTPELRFQQASDVKTILETIAATPAGTSAATGGAWMKQGIDYRSPMSLFGLPLLHVATGIDPATGRQRVAKGIIAIGDIAQGVIALGGVAMGGLAFGGMAMGVLAFGGCALGLVSVGGLAVALIAAIGGGAIAPIALGGGAIGFFAFGGKGWGMHVLDSATRDPAAQEFFNPWEKETLANMNQIVTPLMILMITTTVGVPCWLYARLKKKEATAHLPDGQGAGLKRSGLGWLALCIAGLNGVLGTMVFYLVPVWSVLYLSVLSAALLGILLSLSKRKTRSGQSAIFVGGINVIIFILLVVSLALYFAESGGKNPKSGQLAVET